MLLKSYMFRKITIVGVGLMGGSLGMAIKKAELAKEVVGLSHRQKSLEIAQKMSAIDEGMIDVKKAVENADLIVLAAPVTEIVKLLTTISPYLKRGCIITDLGSSKSEITEAANKILPEPSNFVGSHPLVGSEKKGVEFARDDLYQGSVCIMTPTERNNQFVREKVKQLWTRLGAQVIFLPANEHDEILAYISHLPHLIAYGLMQTVPPPFLKFATQNFKDSTRIASSPPKLWNDIFLTNSSHVVKSLDELVKCLGGFRKSIVDKDEKELIRVFTIAKENRDSMNAEEHQQQHQHQQQQQHQQP